MTHNSPWERKLNEIGRVKKQTNKKQCDAIKA
jgi:hypothetical protein